MGSNAWKAREKVTQKMTRDGLVEQNRATGEKRSVSCGERDFNVHFKGPEDGTPQARAGPLPTTHKNLQPPVSRNTTSVQHSVGGNSPQADVPSENRAEEESPVKSPVSGKSVRPGIRTPGTKQQYRFHGDAEKHADSPELQFTRGEAALGTGEKPQKAKSPRSEKAFRRARIYDAKLADTRDRLPTRNAIHLKREVDESGKVRHRLHFDREIRERTGSSPVSSLAKGATASAIEAVREQMQEPEQENTGIEAGQAAGNLAARGISFLRRNIRSTPYRRVTRLERKSVRANTDYLYQKALEKNPAIGSNPLSRMIQKRKIRKQYAKAARAVGNSVKSVAKGTAASAGKIRHSLKRIAGPHKKTLALILAILFVLSFLVSLIASCSNMLNGGFQSILATSYTASDDDINRAEAYYSGLEASLKKQIDNAERDHPGYDEYDYQIGNIGHDPHELISYLTALYDDFTFDRVQPVLQQLFNRQYQLSFIPKTETRQRTVTETDPLTGKASTHQETYTYKILTVNLDAADFSEIVSDDLSRAGASEKYAVYLQTRGNRQYFVSPFSFDWNPFVVSVNPDESAQIDVAEGTQVLSMLDGTVTQVGGGTVVIDDGKGLRAVCSGCLTVGVRTGQTVKKGVGIGTAGSGFSILVSHDGTALNPILFILDPVSDTGGGGSGSLSGSVEANRKLVTQIAGQYGMNGYINLILAVMQQESGGRGSDPMQAAEGPYNKKYLHRPNGITDPAYSIQCGIQELKASLQAAGCTSPTDMDAIRLALQGYNFGSGFISWAKERGGYSQANAVAFSQMEAAKMGWSSYGDVKYVQHVLRYYKTS
jgi:murein DD-endopeptidase MepM/ murein hydrolase activator NlpD